MKSIINLFGVENLSYNKLELKITSSIHETDIEFVKVVYR